jgi:hypothetical protein
MITAALYFLANAGRAERVQVAQLFFNRTAEGSCFVWATPFAGGVSAALEKTQSETLRGLVGDVQSVVQSDGALLHIRSIYVTALTCSPTSVPSTVRYLAMEALYGIPACGGSSHESSSWTTSSSRRMRSIRIV